MSECKTIKCPTCGNEVDETFVEQQCPRCQTLIEAKFACGTGSCNSCIETNLQDDNKSKDSNPLKKLMSLFQKK